MNRSYVIAGGIFLIISLYMAIGIVGCGRSTGSPATVAIDDSLGKAVMTVRAREMEAIEIAREVVVPGRTDAARRVLVRAETGGRVDVVLEKRGAIVSVGAPLLRLDLDTRPERVERARADLAARKIDFEAVEQLAQQNLSSESEIASNRAGVSAAEEALAAVELDLKRATVIAPFDGVINDRYVEEGDYVQAGDPVALCLEIDPLIVTGEVTELQISHLQVGEHGVARFADGTEIEGSIRFVDTDADPGTRTFTVELEVANPGGVIPAGKTAAIIIETERVLAYEISVAHISIDDEGRFGVKYLDSNDIVRFAPVDVVRSTPRTVWLTGLPDQIRLITMGQGFTQPGDAVKVVKDLSGGN